MTAKNFRTNNWTIWNGTRYGFLLVCPPKDEVLSVNCEVGTVFPSGAAEFTVGF